MVYTKHIINIALFIFSLLFLNTQKTHSQDEFKVNYIDDKIEIENSKVKICLAEYGINKIFGVSSLHFKNKANETLSYSDWISPYIVRDLSKKDTKDKIFTGGFHSRKLADNKEVETAKSLGFKLIRNPIFFGNDEIKILSKNKIKAYNSDDYVIEETLIWTIKKDKIFLDLNIKALKDIEISRYYGVMSLNFLDDAVIHYKIDGKTINSQNSAQYSESFGANSGIKSIEQYSKKNKNFIEIAILDGSLSNFDYKGDEKPFAFTIAKSKSYFNIVNGRNLTIKKDKAESLSFSMKFSNKTK